MRFSKNLEANLEHLKQTLSLEKNFDVVYLALLRSLKKTVQMLSLNGFCFYKKSSVQDGAFCGKMV